MSSCTVGYAGGSKSIWPTYKAIGDYTEAYRLVYDPTILTYRQILEKYFQMQGDDVFSPNFSRQYRNAILVHNIEQQIIANSLIDEIRSSRGGKRPSVDVEVATDFYQAEDYHLKYYEKALAAKAAAAAAGKSGK